ncbi:pyroglutamyl-peptidase I [Clostridium tarantellae]|uniref:Pyrrolidone-carboxylate peptidase n=1 Tax=Clostridium tarantellae TaxID=39493 RepID=A0A6I1MQG1_9CLOT|nr:pyroglutamyl-peptidase I [Clostridium tarantellae]MPQ43111.1 pyroglutamyl-peptidase I [Clostridium tarantellae]
MKVLITGFDPFGGESINPAWESVKLLPKEIARAEIIKLEIPTVFGKSIMAIEKAVEEHKPDIVIAVGQAGGRFLITPERVAINVDDARIEDNEGNQPIDKVIYEKGANAYFSNLPIKAMVRECIKIGLPAAVSNTAGTFVCNHVMYGIMHLINTRYPKIRGGFIHVPYIPSQVILKPNTPCMSIVDIALSLECCIRAAVENKEDISDIGGTIC